MSKICLFLGHFIMESVPNPFLCLEMIPSADLCHGNQCDILTGNITVHSRKSIPVTGYTCCCMFCPASLMLSDVSIVACQGSGVSSKTTNLGRTRQPNPLAQYIRWSINNFQDRYRYSMNYVQNLLRNITQTEVECTCNVAAGCLQCTLHTGRMDRAV